MQLRQPVLIIIVVVVVFCSQGALARRVGRQYMASNAFDAKLKHSRAAVRVGTWCSGTLVSSNIVYTAAHCVYGPNGKRLSPSVSSPVGGRDNVRAVDRVYLPARYAEAWYRRSVWLPTKPKTCNLVKCSAACGREPMRWYANIAQYDYALLHLNATFPVCKSPLSQVAATLAKYPPVSLYRSPYEKFEMQHGRAGDNECFLVGFGMTDNGLTKTGALLKIGYFRDKYQTYCGIGLPDFEVVFFNSSDKSHYSADICQGDSGSGLQCASKNGSVLTVVSCVAYFEQFFKVGAASRMLRRDARISRDAEKNCRAPHNSIAVRVLDHYDDLIRRIAEWAELETYQRVHADCRRKLQQPRYQFGSIEELYFRRPA